MPPRMRAVSCTIALALVGASGMVDAQLYKYRDASGAWVYTDREPPAGAKAETMTVDLEVKAPRIEVEQQLNGGQLNLLAINECACDGGVPAADRQCRQCLAAGKRLPRPWLRAARMWCCSRTRARRC